MTRDGAVLMRRLTTCVMLVGFAIALAPEAAGDHQTVGGGTFRVADSDGTCTEFRIGEEWLTSCPGSFVNVPPNGGDYLVVPLGSHSWVSCDTYAPDGLLFEHEVENLADVPRKQSFWNEKGWGPYTPEAMCQLW